ncbi:MAG: glycoside hydrolase family 3 C-terminal domain-containing protein [Puniceicoccales bacterium]|nr:glycoside hydrolase family 3 C-terminal domain-containing protein [Puniceicoccales bacterium]
MRFFKLARVLPVFLFPVLLLNETIAADDLAAQPPYKDASLPADVRVNDLLKRMTLDEKCDQLRQSDFSRLQIFEGSVSEESLERVFRDRSPGMVRMDGGASAETNIIKVRDLRTWLSRKSRLGIPPLFITGATCGVTARGATIFPSPLALGATWNPDLVRDMAARVATEATAIGATQVLAPSFALGRDPRFGGITQCFSECPTLTTSLGLAFLEGLQGNDISVGKNAGKEPVPVLAPNKVFGTALHFTGWGAADGGLYGAPVSLSTRALRALHFPPFEDAVRKGQVQTVMPVISLVNSVPGHANAWMLDTVLRKEWNFPGCVISAPGGVAMNHSLFFTARDNRAASTQALTAGVDVETGSATYKELAAAVRDGVISEAEIDTAAARVLRLKFLAGLFEDRRIADPDVLSFRVHTADSRTLARRLARESIILLKNADEFLPLDTDRIKTLAVIGPNAARSQFGDNTWSRDDEDGITVLRGLRTLLGNKVRVHHIEGCSISGTSRAEFDAAVALAKGADAVLVVLGDESSPPVGGGGRSSWKPLSPTSGEGYDVMEPVLPGVQKELVRALVAVGRPVIVLFLHGRPYSTPWIKENATAILSMFYAGEEQGNAFADVLFGNADPGGRLPVSIAQGAGGIPTTYDYNPGGRGIFKKHGTEEFPGRDYVFTRPVPLWPFGFGLSYARFQYSDFVIETPQIKANDTVRMHFTVTNLATRDGTDVAQIYFHNASSLVAGPSLRLVRFKKIEVKAGKSIRVEVEFNAREMSEWDRLVRSRVTEPGEYEIFLGTSAEDIVLRGVVHVQ